jgi:hypothetical protein
MNNFGQSLPDRITHLLGDRKIHPWGKAIGISKGSLESIMKNGGMPGADTLTAIRRSENVNLTWLLEGKGAPYSVNTCSTDQAAAELLDTLTHDESWEVTLVSDGACAVLVLSQPGAYAIKDREVEYTIVEVIAGAIGQKTIATLRNNWVHGIGVLKMFYVTVDTATLEKIERGEVGTYRLFHALAALLKPRKAMHENEPLLLKLLDAAGKPAKTEESTLLDLFRAMKPEDQQTALRVVEGLANTPNPK